MTVAIAPLADEQARVVAMTAHDRSMLIEAGAGSGKTAVMAGRLALLLAGGVSPKAIAAVTFTELAASELLARVREFVDDLLDGRVPRELQVALPSGLSVEQRSSLGRAATALDEMTCSTIHGFCQRLIKPYPVEANLDPGASLMDPGHADLVFADSVDRWLRAELDTNDGSLISELIFQDPSKGSELIASAAKSLRDHRVLTLPSTGSIAPSLRAFKNATEEFENYVTGLVAQEVESIDEAAAFRSMSDSVVFALGDESPAALVRLLAALPHPSLCTGKGTFGAYNKKGKWKTAAKAAGLSVADGELYCIQAGERRQRCCETWNEFLQSVASRVLADVLVAVQPVADSFTAYKRSAALLDFDDLIFAARDLLRDHPQVRDALASRYRHVLVDEFQDTDPLQAEIFWRLCGEPQDDDESDWASYRIRHGALFLVGDPKQAIYRFRGADVAAYIRAREAIRSQDPSNVLSISTNFRSCASILTFVNEQFASHLTVEKGQPGFTALDTFHPDHNEGLCVAALGVTCGGGIGKPSAGLQRDCEAEAVAELCSRLIDSQIIVDRKTDERRRCRPGDIALLAPGGTELWRYEEALEKHGVPVATQAGKGFYRRQEIQDLIAITRVLADSRDTVALLALLRGPLVGLTEEEILDMVWDQPSPGHGYETRPKLQLYITAEAIGHEVARDVIEKLQAIRRKVNVTTPHQLLAEAVDALRVRPIILQRYAGRADRPLANIDLYLSLARPYAVRGIRAFAEAMTEAWDGQARSAEGRPDAQEEAVSLVTMHASKGLEWPIVIPINTMTGGNAVRDPIVDGHSREIFMQVFGVAPTGYDQAKASEVAERERERLRLWYVAATRARELLILPKLDVAQVKNSWNALVEFDLDSLPLIKVDEHSLGFETPDVDPPNNQTRELFAKEAAIIVDRTPMLRWIAPSRGEDPAAEPNLSPVPQVMLSDEEPAIEADCAVQGGRERGLIIHKLIEEMLTGETSDDLIGLQARSAELIQALGLDLSDDPALGLSPSELATVARKTLDLPQIASIRSKLVPEFPVYGSGERDGVELATFGVVDAICIEDDGRPSLVIDWKSDVSPSASATEYYSAQVRRYLEATGISEGMIVFVTTGATVVVTSP